jgi:predicted ribosome quality control (RQC) complex YloA/Tae2 family protein
MGKKDYQRPAITAQDQLAPEDIKEKLKDYKHVKDPKTISVNSHIRYFVKNPKEGTGFRLGGYVKLIDMEKRYMVLTNGSHSWSVQFDGNDFFKKVSVEDQSSEKIAKLEKEIEKLRNDNKLLKETLDAVEQKYRKEREKYKALKYHQ